MEINSINNLNPAPIESNLGDFEKLPKEITLHIISYLLPNCTNKICRINKKFNLLGNTPAIWKALITRLFSFMPTPLGDEPNYKKAFAQLQKTASLKQKIDAKAFLTTALKNKFSQANPEIDHWSPDFDDEWECAAPTIQECRRYSELDFDSYKVTTKKEKDWSIDSIVTQFHLSETLDKKLRPGPEKVTTESKSWATNSDDETAPT